ncbi:hypothetical protein [Tenacibaculum aiptasiae]|uniref:hypothetical protein n=1 Tax=Tenacibaculum aiptasiae TaxID=426481 RepID=UPI0024923849|nr:hypothetical protein [Tenacibaculum aiptasiae]
MASFKVEVTGKNVLDKMNRQGALQKIDKHASTEALIILGEIMEEKPGASDVFVSQVDLLKTFI